MIKGGYIYIVSNKRRTVFYVGVTSDLSLRSWQHKHGEGSGFTKKYNCHDLIYYEFYDTIEAAITREKQLKKWKREWKEELVSKMSPEMKDLYDEVGNMH